MLFRQANYSAATPLTESTLLFQFANDGADMRDCHPHWCRIHTRLPVRTSHPFAKIHWPALARGGFARLILVLSAAPISRKMEASIERFRSYIISVRSR